MSTIRSVVITLAFAAAAWGQAYVPMPVPKMQFFDNAGNPLAGGLVLFYTAGTSTPATVYVDSVGTPLGVSVSLDSAGRATVFLGPQAYKVELRNSAGQTLWIVDGVAGSNAISSLTTLTITGTLTAQGSVVFPNGATCNGSGCTGMVFSSAATFNGGLTTLSGTNSLLYIGTGGNFYNRTFSGSDVNCTGITDGWMGLRTDNSQLEVCSGQSAIIFSGTGSSNGPSLSGTQTWTGVNTYTSAANFNGGITTGASTNSSIHIGTGGNFWMRPFSGSDASCTAVADGWSGVRTDTSPPTLQVCVGGVNHKANLN